MKTMNLAVLKRFVLAVSLAVVTVSVGAIARAENPEHMRQLLSTGDCPECDLSGATFRQLDFTGANLAGANLAGAQFSDVQLVRANLEGADLSDTFFRGSDLTGATLENADLSNVSSFFVCNALSTYSYSEEISQSDVDECVNQLLAVRLYAEVCHQDSRRVDLLDRLLEGLQVEGYDQLCGKGSFYESLLYYPQYFDLYQPGLLLRGANLSGTNLSGADLSGVELSYAVLAGADAATATFDYATLFDADVSGLENADLTKTWDSTAAMADWLNAAQLSEAEEAKKTASRLYVGSMNRAQQAYYLEYNEFSTDVPALGLGLSNLPEYDAFEFGIVADAREDVTVQYVLSKEGDVPSSMGVVYVVEEAGEQFSRPVICELDVPRAVTVAELPDVSVETVDVETVDVEGSGADNFVVNCPEGWSNARG